MFRTGGTTGQAQLAVAAISRLDVDVAARPESGFAAVLGSCSAKAEGWVRNYFDADANRLSRKPYAYPAYDSLATGSHSDELNDGDLLAPTLLNAAPSIAAFYALQSAREQVEAGLRATPASVTLESAVEDSSLERRMQALVGVLDERKLRGVKLTTLTKVLHRKRPDFMPLHDKFVKACFVGAQEPFPMRNDKARTWSRYWAAMATAINDDIQTQVDAWADLGALAGKQVATLRVFDVVAWNAGKQLLSQREHRS
jgi:hypothetical protein